MTTFIDDHRETYYEAYVDMLARNDLGSWLWRENPNPDSPHHAWLGWEPPHDYTEAPDGARCDDPPPVCVAPGRDTGRLPGGEPTIPVEMVARSPGIPTPRTRPELAGVDRRMPPSLANRTCGWSPAAASPPA